MVDVVDRLTTHLTKMAAGEINESTVHRLMVLIRELLEQRGERKTFSVLTMFCDWSVHPKLDKSPEGNALLDMLDDTWGRESQNVDEQLRKLLSRMSPSTLRDQMVQLLGKAFINPTVIIDVSACTNIIKYLTEDLTGKPIARRAEQTKKLTAERLQKGYRFIADQLLFIRDDEGKRQLRLVSKQIEPPSGGEVRVQIPWPY